MNKRHLLLIILIIAAVCVLCAGCGGSGGNNAVPAGNSNQANNSANVVPDTPKAPIEDGTYSVKFDTDSSMFHVNEAYKGRGTLTVKDGVMTLHVSLASKNIINLFPGTAEEAQKDGAKWLQPTTDTVKYSDGTTEDVYGFDIPVPYLDKEFECALLGTKGKWYSHKVSVSDPQPVK